MPGIETAFANHTHIDKIRVAKFVNQTINAKDPLITAHNGMMNTVLGILAKGNMNCAGNEVDPTKDLFTAPKAATVNTTDELHKTPRQPNELEDGVVQTEAEKRKAEELRRQQEEEERLRLEEEERRHAAGGPFAGRTALNNWCNRSLKDEFPFLRDVDKFALTNAAWALAGAYERMFDGTARHPRFKSRRRSRRSYTTNLTGSNIAVLDGCIKLPRIGKVKAVIHRRAPEGHVLKSATVSMERDGTYYCSVLYEYGEAAASVPSPEQNAVGLDYKSDGLYVSSDGEVCGSPKYYRKAQKRLARAQRVLSRRKGSRKGETESNNHRRQKRRVAKLHRHVANQRKDFLHKQSTAIAKRYSLVCVEDLDMRALSNKGFGIGRAVMDNGYGMFLDMLDYKLRDRC